MGSKSRSKVSRALLGAVLIVGFVWLFYVGILANNATKRRTKIIVPFGETWKVIGRKRHHFHQGHDFHYVSKRGVPNGPDPIHNRRASKSRQPPGRT